MKDKLEKISRRQLYNAVYDQFHVTRKESFELVNLILSEITKTLVSGEDVCLSSFGTISVQQRGARVGRNLKTGESVNIAPRRILKFKPSRLLLKKVNSSLIDESN